MHPASAACVPASAAQIGGKATHFPSRGGGCVHMPPSLLDMPESVPASDWEPSAVSQY